jgi:hypothetical protein
MKKRNHQFKNRYQIKTWIKFTAMFVLVGIVGQIAYPTAAWALTSGPQQPEANNFTPADVSNLVDPFTGDFSYNIPMFDIGGYPVNLSYNSGVTMDQEASWVGLGWNLNTGAITRDVRGLPDDFWGDPITRDYNTKPNITAGGTVAVGAEFVGADLGNGSHGTGGSLSYGLQMKYNNYAGFSVGQTLNGGLQFPSGTNLNLGLSTTNGGLDINPNVSFSSQLGEKDKTNYKGSLGFGLNINSRTGLSQMSLNASVSASKINGFTNNYKDKNGNKDFRFRHGSISAGGGGAISFLNPTFTPQNTMPYSNFNFSGSFKIGGAVVFGDISGTISGFYSEQKLMTNRVINPSYGYMYSEKGQYLENASHDFNREKDGSFTNNTPALPLTNYTYDAFNIKAQGIGGSFRGFRNDVGHVFDPSMLNPSAGGSFGMEVDLGNAVDIGIDVNVNWNESRSGKWINDNPAKNQLRFTDPKVNSLAENVFFKMVGEKVAESDQGYLNRIQTDKAVRVGLQSADDPSTLNNLLSDNTNNTSTSTTLNNNNSRNTRMIRNTAIQCFTVAEVKQGFPVYAKYLAPCAQDHHIGLIVVTTADGTRYVFGLPAYNKVKREVTFAVGGNIEGTSASLTPDANNLVSYLSDPSIATINNPKGIDRYYDKTSTPAFVYTWYLTEVLSPDYSDLTGDGATPDDLGGYVKFRYGIENSNGSVTPNVPNYKWRTPSGAASTATYSEGLKTISTDQKATYLYGEKDIWYPTAIESKTQLVKFVYTSRRDGFGVTGEHGAIGGTAQSKIDKINIYSRQDYAANPSTAIPLKTIHFEYDYSLCGNTANNNTSSEIVNGTNINLNKGKLTLKKVYFTYRNSNKAKYSAYNFEYPGVGDANNPNYDPTANDRWGTYRKNTVNTANGIPKNEDFPYTLQDQASASRKTVVDDLSKAWNLKAINLPTGGKINIEYESDDYAYVQDKKACRMFQLLGAGHTKDSSPSNDLYTGPPTSITNNSYLFFELEHPISGLTEAEANKMVKEKYFDDPNEPQKNGPNKFLYFRFLLNANNGNEAPNKNEYVSGYADVDAGEYCGVWDGGASLPTYTKGWVKLKEIPNDASGPNYQQISKAGWAFSRINTPFYANNQAVPGQADPGDFIRTILNADIIAQLIQFFQGPNNKMQSQGFASKFEPQKSWIRLMDPDGFKYGGGHRVKKVTISDNWANMESNETSFDYGQEYLYTTEDNKKSSGVASFEPMYGADENPFRIPVFYDKTYGPLIPDDRFYLEEPFGESFFPSPMVGYSRVKIMNLQRANVTKTATGYTVKEFYTAKDFPMITKRTKMDPHRAKIDPILAIFSPYVFDFMAVSQGFSIELNDMHGKPLKESVYQEDNDVQPISKVEHFYKTESFDETQVNNKVLVLEKNGQINDHEMGTEVDMVSDFRENASFAGNIDLGFNTDYTQFGPIPLIILAIFPKVKFEDTRFRSASVTKVINRYAIETKTEAYDLGSKVMTENMLYNGISGEPLSTKVNNEYEDERYTMSIPAYWAYPGMGHSSNNEGFVLRTSVTGCPGSCVYVNWIRDFSDPNHGKITLTNAHDYLEPGDELLRSNYTPERNVVIPSNLGNNFLNRVWVSQAANGDLYLIDQYGGAIHTSSTEPIDFKVIRSGHRNILSPKIAEYATLKKPVSNNNFAVGESLEVNNTKNVLSVTAQTFHEQWKSLKRYDNCLDYSVCECTPYQFAMDYLNMFVQLLNNNTAFVYGDLLLYDQYGYHNGFTSAIVNQLLTTNPTCSTLTTVTRAKLYAGTHIGDSLWIPATDAGFLGGTPLVVEIYLYDNTGSTEIYCSSCRTYNFQLVSPSAVPSSYLNPTPGIGCSGSSTDDLYAPITIGGLDQVLKLSKVGSGFGDCGGAFRTCSTYVLTANDNNIGDVVNPYIKNILGKWRPYESYTFIEDRKGDVDLQVNLRTQGYINGYTPFWTINAGNWEINGSLDGTHWKRTTTMTQYHPSGPQVEEKNALDIYSAAQYGYMEQLAVAVAQNAQYKEIGFDGFEDYDYLDNTIPQYSSAYNCVKKGHFKFDVTTGNSVSLTESHTGKRSMSVSSLVDMTRDLQVTTAFRNTRAVPYVLQQEDMSEFFGPLASSTTPVVINTPAKTFIFSFWAKQADYSPIMFDFTSASGDIKLNSASIIVGGSLKKSPIIDGWQKFEYTFIIPANSTGTLKIELKTSGATTYFDDVRIHPFNSMMKSYVYNPLDLRFMAELDENNYATFYEYDEDGALIRVKKETERGVMTIQENRYGSYKQ